jgi:short-subunit dehydrogenase
VRVVLGISHRPRRLDGKRVLITGAARGLGFELATVLAARGARLSLVGLEPDLLQSRAATLGAGHTWFTADVTDQSALDAAVSGTVAALGGIDVLVTNAGVANNGTFAGGPVDAHVRTIDVNVNGTIRTVGACLPHLIDSRGYALLIASVGSFAMMPGLGTYCASKAAVEHVANALRQELAHRGVKVGSAHPTWLNTDLVRDAEADLQSVRQARGRLRGPLGMTLPPRVCAEALADAIATRKRRVYVPRSLAVLAVLRPLVLSALGEAVLRRQLRTAEFIPALEAEVAALGRAFGATSTALPVATD